MLVSIRSRNIAGFTLPEVMVALVINAILFSAFLSIFIATLIHYEKVMSTSRLNQELQMALQLMTNDIRRAGYSSTASSDVGAGQNNNQFMASSVDVYVNAGNNCILFSYDHNGNGSLPSISSSYDDERYGYRLNGNVVQARPPGASFSCGASASEWENMTDPNVVKITALTFTLTTTTLATGPGATSLALRSVDISITGQLAADSSITKTLTQHVRIRNDKYIP